MLKTYFPQPRTAGAAGFVPCAGRPGGRGCLLLLLLAVLACLEPARALEFLDSGSPTANTTRPTDATGYLWDQQISTHAGNASAVPIAERYFLGVAHASLGVGATITHTEATPGPVPDPWNYGTLTRTVAAAWNCPQADLRLYRIADSDPPFHYYPFVNRDPNLLGKTFLIFGRGLPRGTEVSTAAGLRGWRQATTGKRLRWGQGRVDYLEVPTWGPTLTPLIEWNFSPVAAVPWLAFAADGDSGGTLYVWSPAYNQWLLTGNVRGAYNTWRTTQNGTTFKAAIFDSGGLWYVPSNAPAYLIPDTAGDQSVTSVASSIPHNLAWIEGITGPLPAPLCCF